MHGAVSVSCRQYMLRVAMLFGAVVLVSCGGGSGGSAGATSQPSPPALLACGAEPIPVNSPWKLDPGFPTCLASGAGVFPEGPQNGIVLGNVDSNPDLEILVAGTATFSTRSLQIFKHTGDPVPGWPPPGFPNGTTPFVLATLSSSSIGDAVFAGTVGASNGTGDYLTAATVDVGILTGWPRDASNYVDSYPAAYDINGDGIEEIFTDEEDHSLHAYQSSGEPLPGWPVGKGPCGSAGGQQLASFAFSDLDHDGQTEIAAVSRHPDGLGVENCLVAFNMDGTAVNGFPVFVPATSRDPTITLGDVDNDGEVEIIYVVDIVDPVAMPAPPVALVISGAGELERTIQLSGLILYSASASILSDMDGDSVPEIIVLTEGTLNVVRGDGAPLAGFPLEYLEADSGKAGLSLENCGAVTGDIDGDAYPEIVFCISTGDGRTELWAVDRRGVVLPGSPVTLMAGGSLPRGPSLGDIDNDGQNEIVVATTRAVWVLRYGSLPSGEIQWGQWGRDSRHTNRYP